MQPDGDRVATGLRAAVADRVVGRKRRNQNAAARRTFDLGHRRGYAGLFAVLVFPAPIALILGIIAIYDIKRHPKRHGMGRAIFGLVMGAVFTLLMLFFLVLAAIKGFK